MNSLVNIVLINLFWVLYLIPGYFIYTFLASGKSEKYWIKSVVFSFFLSCLLLLPLIILSFVLTIPSLISVIYFLILVLGAFYLFKTKFPEKINLRQRIDELKAGLKTSDIWLKIFLVLIFIDILFSIFLKGFVNFGFDTWVHLAKINKNIFDGISTSDPFFFEEGRKIIHNTYGSNVVHILLSIPGKLFGIDAINIWAYTISFLRILTYLSIFVFVKELFGKKSLAFFVSIIYFAAQFASLGLAIPAYPVYLAFLVFLFIIYLFFDLKEGKNFEPKTALVLYALSFLLLSFSHQVQTLLAILFLGFLSLILLLSKEITIKGFFLRTLPFVPALFNPLFTFLNSKYVPKEAIDIGTEGLQYITKDIYSFMYPASGLMLGTLTLLAGLVILFTFDLSKQKKTFLCYGIIFNLFLLYTPILGFMNKLIPVWAIVRHEYFNFLLVTAISYVPFWFILKYGIKEEKFNFNKNFLILTVLAFLVAPNQPGLIKFKGMVSSNFQAYRQVDEMKSLVKDTGKNTVILANVGVSFSLPALCDCYIVGVDDTRTTDAYDTKQRETDVNDFFKEGAPKEERKKIIEKYNAKFIFFELKEEKKVDAKELDFSKISETTNYSIWKK